MSEVSDLVDLLHSKTMEGKVPWDFDSEDRIITMQGRNQIGISKNSPIGISIEVRNKDGIRIAGNTFMHGSTYDILAEIFERARRKALKIDETLLDISNHIKAL